MDCLVEGEYRLSRLANQPAPPDIYRKNKNRLPLLPAEIERFLGELSPEEISIFQDIAGEQLRYYQYELV